MWLTWFAVKLPFPITVKFKSMLQAGVQTKDMDPRWMSSISWYFLCIFGLQFVYVFLLGDDNGMRRPRLPFQTSSWLTNAPLQPPVKWRKCSSSSRCP